MTETAKQSKFEKHADRIFRNVFRRRNPTAADRERLASEIAQIVATETYGLQGELDRAKRDVASLSHRLVNSGYDGPMVAGEHKPRKSRAIEKAKA